MALIWRHESNSTIGRAGRKPLLEMKLMKIMPKVSTPKQTSERYEVAL
jgi:hypothetical protein